MHLPSLSALVLASLLATGCNSILGLSQDRVVGTIFGLAEGTPSIVVPSTVRAGEPFTVQITTVWRNTCANADETVVSRNTSEAVLTPYDVVNREGACGQALVRLEHTATVRFDTPGAKQIVIRGKSSFDGEVQSLTYPVAVE